MSEPPLPPPGNFPPPGNYPPPGYYPPPGGYPPAGGYYAPVPGVTGALPKAAYTPWLTRVAAYCIDTLPVAALVGLSQVMQNDCVTVSTDSTYDMACSFKPSGFGLFLWLIAAAFAIWNLGYRQGTTGSSIGKSVMKFKVVAEQTGLPIGFGKSILRQFAHLADAIICNIGYLFPLWDAKRQTIADKIMSTICLPL